MTTSGSGATCSADITEPFGWAGAGLKMPEARAWERAMADATAPLSEELGLGAAAGAPETEPWFTPAAQAKNYSWIRFISWLFQLAISQLEHSSKTKTTNWACLPMITAPYHQACLPGL